MSLSHLPPGPYFISHDNSHQCIIIPDPTIPGTAVVARTEFDRKTKAKWFFDPSVNGTYQIRSRTDHWYLMPGPGGVVVATVPFNWAVEPAGDDNFRIKFPFNDLVLFVPKETSDDEFGDSPVLIQPAEGLDGELWTLVPAKNLHGI
ncbi:hypothetical protein SISNIDRAFT_450352 [Sistotremastrum niveocremeum HHB9708]|uniref:Ricin B lectin domain-containing protein n=1 Tax=Sistotremastrum niveocremeum HHB9708 TaxID=1314777 RepID=A0A164Y747_9AGAM|nr:hypothetical protein SISNIDRAFT_450352 [Sistotremastrum niveocremeum HHB9708]